MSLWLATAFLTGLISSLHCVGMCGPLVAALPIGRLPATLRWRAIGLYHFGRIATYSTLGAMAGSITFGLNLLGWQRPLAVISGVILLISLVGRSVSPIRLNWPWLTQKMAVLFKETRQEPRWVAFAGLGILNGLLPCGFTYLALAGTLATNTPVSGAAYMLLFGLGTLPALLSVNLVTSLLSAIKRQYINRVLSAATVIVAILLIGRGLATYSLPAQVLDTIPICRGLLAH
ncbi:sulfite exporter TauE/SafE family protein [Spirosoma daeguense]